MKNYLLATAAAISLSACAGTKITNTVVATGAASPKYIYVRPFDVADGAYTGAHGNEALRAIRQSQAPDKFAGILSEEMTKLAPARVLRHDESVAEGWIMDGSIELVEAGNPALRALGGRLGAGRSGILVHVRITEAGSSRRGDEKGGHGSLLYEFDVAGGSRLMGAVGTLNNSGLGYSEPFDMRNVAERIRVTLDPDGDRHGFRETGIR